MNTQESAIILTFEDIKQAQKALSEHLPVTPLTHSPELSRICKREIFIKWDNKFRTGSFKERGALNFLLNLKKREKSPSVCTASAGNHALAVSYHSQLLNIPCSLVMPTYAPLVKIKTASHFGAKVTLFGNTFYEAYDHAEALAKETGKVFVPGFDHNDVIAGQGVSGLEIAEQSDQKVDAVVIPIGGGGLAAGIAYALKTLLPDLFILGVRSKWIEVEHKDMQFPSIPLADGIAVKRLGNLTKPIIEQYVDKIVSLGEDEVARAIIDYLNGERTVIEGAGAAALAAVQQGHLPSSFSHPVLLACGSNIDLNLLARLIHRSQSQQGRLLRVTVSVPDRPGSLAKLTKSISDQKANVLETYHERGYTDQPGNVEITFMLETKDEKHKVSVLKTLSELGLNPVER